MTPPSTGLTPAHRGYAYQDLVVALRLLDLLTGRAASVQVEDMHAVEDRFDDAKVTDASGLCTGIQIKHSTVDRQVERATFATNRRGLRLDNLVLGMLRVREAATTQTDFAFQIVTTDRAPSAPEAGSLFTRASQSTADSLQRASSSFQLVTAVVQDLARRGDLPAIEVEPSDLNWALSRLWIVAGAPRYSGDLRAPGPAEQILLSKVRDELGAGSYPNHKRSPEDVAASLILSAQAARTEMYTPTRETLLHRLQLRTDYGSVPSSHPVVESLRVGRSAVIGDLSEQITAQSRDGGVVVITGPPGHGKSWLADELERHLSTDEWLLSAHYCYVNDADSNRETRTFIETIHGSLIAGIARREPTLVSKNLPLLTASRETLEQTLLRASETTRVALVIDGLDHITRVRGALPGHSPSLGVCEALAAIELPAGVVMIVLSQPGDHLTPFRSDSSSFFTLPGMSDQEIEDLVRKQLDMNIDQDSAVGIVEAIVTQAAGNALYATYLCREISSKQMPLASAASTLRNIPRFDGDLQVYYEYVYGGLSQGASFVADSLALMNFAISANELRDLVPRPSLVDDAMVSLAPVLRQNLGSGIRIYHESFSRFIRERLASRPEDLASVVEEVVTWLRDKGLYSDARTYRWLLTILSDDARYAEVHAHVDDDFVWKSIGAGHQSRTILRNLQIAAECAVLDKRFDVASRCLQLSNAVHRFQGDQFGSLVEYADLYTHFVGTEEVAASLLEDEQIVLSGRDGLLICAAIDRLGAVAPWAEYLRAYDAEREDGHGRLELDESLAELRGLLRQLLIDEPDRHPNWERLSESISALELPVPEVLEVVQDVYGVMGVNSLISALPDPRSGLLHIALTGGSSEASEALRRLRGLTPLPGRVHDLLSAGLSAEHISAAASTTDLVELTREVVNGVRESRITTLSDWIDACALAARLSPQQLATAEVLCAGEGWYRRWLRFTIALSVAEASPQPLQRQQPLAILNALDGETSPFVGTPRAVDLYFAHPLIRDTLERVLALVDDADLTDAFDTLQRISESTTANLMGMAGGPLAPEALADLTASIGTRAPAVARKQLDDLGSDANGFYSDLTRLRLQRSRLELSLDEPLAAERHWLDALKLLPAYGWHKDSTIEELFGPLENLILTDIAQVRVRLPVLQTLAERVSNHSDGRGMSHVVAQWWRTVAVVDPVWVLSTLLPVVIENCNDSLWIPRLGLEELWRVWSGTARFETAAETAIALADLSLSSILDLLTRSAALSDMVNDPSRRQVLELLISRGDERPVDYSYSSSYDLLAADDAVVDQINGLALRIGLPTLAPRTRLPTEPQRDAFSAGRPSSLPEQHTWNQSGLYAQGLPGVYEAIADLRKHESNSGDASDRLVNTIGYRLVDLSQQGRIRDAEAALIHLADTALLSDGPAALSRLSEGLLQRDHPELTAVAATLAWTRTRGDGWHEFGGRERLECLGLAMSTDPATTWRVLASEVGRAVQRDSVGPSRALTIAAAEGVLGPNVDAFEIWDVTAAIQLARAPGISNQDDPHRPYAPTVPPEVPTPDAWIIQTLALAICSPAREEKRRGLTALRYLLVRQADGVEALVKMLLESCTEVLTLTAVLEVVGESEAWCTDRLAPSIRQLLSSKHLSIRTLARSVLRDSTPPRMEALPAYPTINRGSGAFRLAKYAVRTYSAVRLSYAERLAPGLTTLVIDRAAHKFETLDVNARISEQLGSLASRSDPHLPDAVLAGEEVVEDVLQEVGGAARGIGFIAGDGVASADWELRIASALAPKNFIPLRLELTRCPRPALPEGLPVLAPSWSVDGSRVFSHEIITRDGWTLLGAVEQRWWSPGRGPGRRSLRHLAVIAEPVGEDRELFGWTDTDGWSISPPPVADHSALVDLSALDDWEIGLGGPPILLSPSETLWSLGLHPGTSPFTLTGPDGVVDVRLRTWRSDYVVNEYELTRPGVVGQGLYVSERIAQRLAITTGPLWRTMEQLELSEDDPDQ